MKKVLVWLWNSPTFTTWGNYGVQSFRLLILTPLILTRFDEIEISVWYLLSSISFFGTILNQRVTASFTRMLSFCMGGKSNLAPIKSIQKNKTDGEPNWKSFKRVFGTISTLNIGVAIINILVACVMGYFALNNILVEYQSKASIWITFAMLQSTTFLAMVFQHYQIALISMNYVSLCNRWNILFSILSIIFGFITIIFTDSLLCLVCVIQALSIGSVVRNYYLLRSVENNRIFGIKKFCFDFEIFKWSWEPIYKGFLTQLSNIGVLQYGSIMITKMGDSTIVASYLFSVYLVQNITKISSAPLSSISPILGKLLASNQLHKLSKLYTKRVFFSVILLCFCFSVLLYLENILFFLDVQVNLLASRLLLLICILSFLQSSMNNAASICGVGNYVVMFWTAIFSSLISITLLSFIEPRSSLVLFILSIYLPRLFLYNVRTMHASACILSINPLNYIVKCISLISLSILLIFLSYTLKAIIF